MGRRTNFGDCSVDGCGRVAVLTGYCKPHYARVRRSGAPGGPIQERFHSRSPIERVRDKTDIGGPDDCWLWTGARVGKYGVIRRSNNVGNWYVHRVAWEAEHGPIPEGLTIDHRVTEGICTSTLCVNARHLRLMTRADNGRDGATRQNAR